MILSLWDMLKFSAERFLNISASLQWMQTPEAADYCGFAGDEERREKKQEQASEMFYRL